MVLELVIFWAIFFFILGFTTAYIIFRIREERKTPAKAKTKQTHQPTAEDEVQLPASGKIRVWVEVDGQKVEAEVKTVGKRTMGNPPSSTPPVQTMKPFVPVLPTPIPQVRKPMDTFVRAVQTHSPKPEEPPRSIVTQIDEILQVKINDLQLMEQIIHLVETPDHGMAIRVGTELYDQIGAVPDEQIRDLIRSAIQEWEHRNM